MLGVDNVVSAALRRQIKGSGRLARAVYGDGPHRAVPATLNGLRWEADPLDWMDQQVIINGTYEPEITELLVSLLPPGGVLWDVGANVGVHSLSVLQQRPDAQVIAFEPSAAQYVRLLRNAALNDLPVDAYGIALGDTRGYQKLSVVGVGNSGHNSLTPWPDIDYARQTPVWCDTGAEVMAAGVPAPDVIKVDVEGGELAVLQGFGPALARISRIVFESPKDGPVMAYLRERGFSVEPLPSNGGDTDWLATRDAG